MIMVNGFHRTQYRRDGIGYRASWFQVGSRIFRFHEVPRGK